MEFKRFTPVKRCAILIGNGKWGGSYLGGVLKDLDNMKQFLLSPYGGAWNNIEIFDIVKPISKDTIFQILNKATIDYEYLFIYFSGHGELSRFGDPLFVLPGGEEISLGEIKKVCNSRPTFMISDSCQGIPNYADGGILTESLKIFSATDVVKEFKARRDFDKWIRTLPPMFTYASSVSPGQYAGDGNLGGCYSYKLLLACEKIVSSNNDDGVYGICYPHTLAAQIVSKLSNGEQTPSISGYNRTFQPPFLVKI